MIELILPVLPFSISTTLTPGPNNIMVTISGANFGYKKTIPHILGIAVGLPLMIVVMGFGLGGVFQTFPLFHDILKYVGGAYLFYLAWKVALFHNNSDNNKEETNKPISFIQALMFQWVNPKAWLMSTGAIATFTTNQNTIFMEVFYIALVFCLVCIPSVSFWAVIGVHAKRFFKKPLYLKMFNYAMASLLVGSLILSLFF